MSAQDMVEMVVASNLEMLLDEIRCQVGVGGEFSYGNNEF